MEIGIDEFDDYSTNDEVIEDSPIQEEQTQEEEESEDFLTSLLRSRGIEDSSKIKFENEDGIEEEVSWEDLSNEDRLNIINSVNESPETDLDDSEIQLINQIRSSNMTPKEYLEYVQQSGVNSYVQNSQQPMYSTDQYTDDELFAMDLIARMGDNITDDEVQEALERAKANETLFQKQIGAIRSEYKRQEEEINKQAQLEQEQQAQEQYNQFAQSVVDQINNFTEFQGYDLNLEESDMQELYDFITGVDAAGNNHFAKALADPKVLVRTAYLALNGQQMINDITDYFQKEITSVRKESYKRGLEDAQKKSKSDVIYKQKNINTSNNYAELDDF